MKLPISREYDFDYFVGDVDVSCKIDYEEAERGSRGDYGMQMEPDYPASATLNACFVKGVDIITILSQDQIELIEEAFLNQEQE